MTWLSMVGTDLEHDRHLVNFLNICRKNTLTLNPDKMQFRLPQVSFFGHQWSAKGLSPRSKEDCNGQENGFTWRCWHNEKFPRTCELSQQIQSMFSWVKWASQGNMQARHWIQAYKICASCFFQDKRGNFQKCHSSILQPKEWHYIANWCLQERTWSSDLTELKTSHVCIEGLDWSREELPKLGEGMLSNDMGNGEISLLSLWQAVYTQDWPEASSLPYIRKHMGEILPSIQRLVVRSFPYQPFNVQYRRGKEIPLADMHEQSDSNTSGRRWNSASNCGCESHHLQHSYEFQWNWPDPWRKQLKTLHSIFWDTTFIRDGQLTEGCCHVRFTLSGITEKTSQWRMD